MAKCSVPMWWGWGGPAGTCDNEAYGKRPPCKEWQNGYTGEWKRFDGRYNGYISGLACPAHGGPELKEVAHEGDPCKFCGTPHDLVEEGPCPRKMVTCPICASPLEDNGKCTDVGDHI